MGRSSKDWKSRVTMLRITIEAGDPKGATYDLTEGETLIGRSSAARIRLGAPDASGQHAKIVVKNGQATLENLSRYQTLVDGKPITAPAPLKPGQRIAIGKATILRCDETPGEAPTGEGFEVTGAAVAPVKSDHATGATGGGGESATPAKTGSTPSRTGAAAPTGRAPASDALSHAGSWTGDEGSDGMTRAMQTRVAGEDEIAYLRNAERQRARSRVLLIAGGVLIAGIVGAILATHRPEPETTVAWPVDANGEMIEGRVESPLGGFSLVYPKTDDAEVKTSAGGVQVACTLGQRRDMPVRIALEETVDDRHAQETIEQSIARWKAQLAASGAKWNVDSPLPMNLFVGEDNGILFKTIPYQRQDDASWSGLASVLRHGRRLIIVRVEVHSADRARAEEVLYNRFIDPTTAFVRSHWEGAPELPKASTADILSRAREEMRRLAPATWVDVEEQLASALRKAVAEKKADDEKDALEMLTTLRGRKALWYNEQVCQKEAAVAQGDEARVRRITEMCKAVFSDLNDQRFYDVRKW